MLQSDKHPGSLANGLAKNQNELEKTKDRKTFYSANAQGSQGSGGQEDMRPLISKKDN